jgi:hypothetical protein
MSKHTPPAWGGEPKPDRQFELEVIKDGVSVQMLPVSDRPFYVIGARASHPPSQTAAPLCDCRVLDASFAAPCVTMGHGRHAWRVGVCCVVALDVLAAWVIRPPARRL